MRVRKGAGGRVQPEAQPSFELLEPRLLLSADLIAMRPSAPIEPPLGEHAIFLDLTERDEGPQQSQSPILSIDLPVPEGANDAGPATGDVLSTNLSQGQIGPVDTSLATESTLAETTMGQAERPVVTEAATSNSPSGLPSDPAGPVIVGQQDIALGSETPSIVIRGPPESSCDSLSPLCETTYGDQDQLCPLAELESVSPHESPVTPDLPGLRLVDPDISNWQGQIIYLDFDGEQNVTYRGPVTVGPFDVPAFQAPGELAGQEQGIISEVLAQLEQTFAGSGVIFTTQLPATGTQYSTIYIGGDDSLFAQYGSFLGLAEEVDVGNRDPSDQALVLHYS